MYVTFESETHTSARILQTEILVLEADWHQATKQNIYIYYVCIYVYFYTYNIHIDHPIFYIM